MMNYIWAGIILISLVVGFFTGNIGETATAAMDGAKTAVETMISLLGVMCFWMGMMNIAQKSGLLTKLSKLLQPLISRLFKGVKREEAKQAILMNITANIFGIGNAATPFGIKAMEEMQKENREKRVATNDMCLFVVLNTASIQLIPTTLLALRSTYGSTDPYKILPAVWVVSVVALIFGIIAAKIMEKRI
ncbi:MAG: hypothetical protein IJN39_06700 [Clostridia bacterium]|nr:hypothetical protein [Clostridia bacterium]